MGLAKAGLGLVGGKLALKKAAPFAVAGGLGAAGLGGLAGLSGLSGLSAAGVGM